MSFACQACPKKRSAEPTPKAGKAKAKAKTKGGSADDTTTLEQELELLMDHMDEEGSEEKENEEEETKPSSSSSTAAPSKAATKTAAKTAARASTQMTMTDIFNKNKTQMPPPSMVPFKAASLEVKQESEEKEDPTDVADSEVAGAPTVAPEVAEAVEPNVGNPVEETNTKDSEAVVAVAPDIAPEVAEAVKPNVGNPVEETNTKDSEAVVAVAPDIAPEVAEAVKLKVNNPVEETNTKDSEAVVAVAPNIAPEVAEAVELKVNNPVETHAKATEVADTTKATPEVAEAVELNVNDPVETHAKATEVADTTKATPEVAEAVELNVNDPMETHAKATEVADTTKATPEVAEAVELNVNDPMETHAKATEVADTTKATPEVAEAVEKVETNVSNHSENMPTQETQEEVPKPEALEISNAVSTGTETATTEEIKKQSTVNSTGGSGCASDQIMETTETTKIEITEESQERVAWFPPGQEESQERVAWFPPGQMPEVASVINTAMRHELFERFLSCSSCTIKKEDFDLHSGVDCAEILVKLQSFNAFLEGAQKEVISLTKAELELKRATLRTYQLDCEAAAEPGDPLGDLLLKAIKHEHFLHYVEDRGWNIEEMLAWGSPDTLWEDLVDFNSFLSNSKLTVLDLEPAASSAGVDLADLGFGTLGPELPFAQPASDQVIQESQGHKVESKSKHEEEMSESESTEGDLQIGWNYPPPPTKNHPNIKCILPSATKACWMKLKR